MYSWSRRTLIFCCSLLVSLANVAGHFTPTFDPISLLPTTRICGIQNNDRIIFGERTDLDEFPWLVLIPYKSPGGSGFRCGGSLISERYVMTAAHCMNPIVLDASKKEITHVIFGEWDTSSELDCVEDDCSLPPQYIPIEKTIIHERYNGNYGMSLDDIALLRLAMNAQLNDFVKPICLPLSNELRQSSFVGEDMQVAGWGLTEYDQYSNVKLKARVPVIHPSQCANLMQKLSLTVDSKQICAGGLGDRNACHGDSGGPLMRHAPQSNNWIAVGIVSYGSPNCTAKDWPTMYTRVGAYMDWILSKLEP